MATYTLVPTSVSSSTGWDTSTNFIAKAIDTDNSTYALQNNTTCNATFSFGSLPIEVLTSRNVSFTISAYAKAGRTGASTAALKLVDSTGADVAAAESESWTGTLSTQTTTSVTTKADGSALTTTYIGGCTLNIVPNSAGIYLYEIYVTITYTAGFEHKVSGVQASSIGKVEGIAYANLEKVIGV